MDQETIDRTQQMQAKENAYSILVAVVTRTLPHEWSIPEHFSWNDDRIDAAPPGPDFGRNVFSITALTHSDGRIARVHYDTDDQVYVDCGDIIWSGPLEDQVHAYATHCLDFPAAQLAYAIEFAQAKAIEATEAQQAAADAMQVVHTLRAAMAERPAQQ